MGTQSWDDIASRRFTPEERDTIQTAAKAELERVGLAALRKAWEQTQVELASELGLPQNSISDIEHRSDLLLTTLRKYIHALGGELELRVVFPEATFNLDLEAKQSRAAKARPAKAGKRLRRPHNAAFQVGKHANNQPAARP